MDDIYKGEDIKINEFEIGGITEKDKFDAAKQILFGLAVLYILTVIAYLVRPLEGAKLIDICTTTFPPLATLILASYFRDKV